MNIKQFREWLNKDFIIKVLCVVIALFGYLFHQYSTFGSRSFRVRLDVRSSSNMVVRAGSREQKWVSVTVRGNRDQLAGVTEDDLDVFVDISQQVTAGTYTFPVYCEPKDRLAQMNPLEIHFKPETVELEIEEEVVRYINIDPTVAGQPAHGYERVATLLSPSNIAVRGPKSTVESLNTIQTEKVDIDGVTGEYTQEVGLLDVGKQVDIPRDATVSVTVTVKPVVSTRTFENLSIEYDNLSSNLEMRNSIATVGITVEGEQLVLEGLRNTNFSATADCSLIRDTGTYTVPVFVYAPEGVQVVRASLISTSVSVVRKVVEPEPAAEDGAGEDEAELPALDDGGE